MPLATRNTCGICRRYVAVQAAAVQNAAAVAAAVLEDLENLLVLQQVAILQVPLRAVVLYQLQYKVIQ